MIKTESLPSSNMVNSQMYTKTTFKNENNLYYNAWTISLKQEFLNL